MCETRGNVVTYIYTYFTWASRERMAGLRSSPECHLPLSTDSVLNIVIFCLAKKQEEKKVKRGTSPSCARESPPVYFICTAIPFLLSPLSLPGLCFLPLFFPVYLILCRLGRDGKCRAHESRPQYTLVSPLIPLFFLFFLHSFHYSCLPQIADMLVSEASKPPGQALIKKGKKKMMMKEHVPVRVVDLLVLAQELLLPRPVGVVPAHLVAVLLGLEEGREVDASPHLFAGELTAVIHSSSALFSLSIFI